MKKYRRIEITAFRRRVLIVSGQIVAETGNIDLSINDTDSRETVETGSDEGQEILLEAIRLLKERITGHAPRQIEPTNPSHSDNQIQPN